MQNSINVSDFFKNDLTNYSCYSTLRMIASSIDGQKNSSRKVLYTVIAKNIKDEVKVSNFDGVVQSFSDYLHGSLVGVIQNMAANYVGSNVIPLLEGKGNFGTRFVNEPSAARYIFVKKPKYLDELFDIKDVLTPQYFEGEKIEPLFYVPKLPIILINGAMNGLASGFKQNILPRDEKEIIKYIKGKKADLKPFIKGFKGSVRLANSENSENTQYEFVGKVEHLKKNTWKILEIPPFIEYQKYLEILDNLVDSGKIKNYKDFSNQQMDSFEFEVTFVNEVTEEKALEILKLVKRETEIYNALNENNQVRTFKNVEEIIDYYLSVRKKFLELQKEFDINKLSNELLLAKNKLNFIKLIMDEKLVIFKRPKKEIENDLVNLKFDKIDDSFDYLLKMQIHSFTSETLKKLVEEYREVETNLKDLKEKDVYLEYIKEL